MYRKEDRRQGTNLSAASEKEKEEENEKKKRRKMKYESFIFTGFILTDSY